MTKCDICESNEGIYYGPQHCVFYCDEPECIQIARDIIDNFWKAQEYIHEGTSDD